MHGFVDLLKRFRADERGVFAVIFGLMAIVLVAMAGAAVDYTSMETARNKAQIAMDSAALGLAPKIYSRTEDQLKTDAENLILERLNDTSLTMTVDSADATTATGTLYLEGTLTVPMAFIQLVGISSMTATVSSEATRGSVNLEVGVALDITTSMGSSGLASLQTAVATLVPLVVHDIQVPTYSKMALVPYATAVNVGEYADSARSAVIGATAITAIDWKHGASKSTTDITRANPAVVTTSADHGFAAGEYVYISGIGGMTNVNSKIYKVVPIAGQTKKFSLQNVNGSNVNSTNYSKYSGAGTIQRCYNATCDLAVTSKDHGLATDEYALFVGVQGMTQLNFDPNFRKNDDDPLLFRMTRLSADQYILNSTARGSGYSAYTSGGSSFCTRYGCAYNRLSSTKLWLATAACATERMTDSFTDVAPSAAYLSIQYTEFGACNVAAKIQPLTANKDKLLAYTVAGALKLSGATAGQLGTAWAWYLVSPNFAELFPVGSESRPASYEAPNTLKIVIIMTDGEFNTQYCKGVAPTGSCAAPDGITGTMGGALGQAEDLCANMKAEVVVYTVGFNLDNADAIALMNKCASDPSKAKLANDSEGLIKAFREIGENISDLRLSM